MTAIEVSGLGKRYHLGRGREFWALRDVSFSIGSGEVVGVVGRNGAGKSTLLKVLSRITPPTSGRAVLRGRIGSLLEIGTGFHGDLTGRENIYLNAALLGMRRRDVDSAFEEIVGFAGVDRFLDEPTKHYSSGMQVRLAFAVAACLETDILLVDEVLAVGDAEFQQRCIGRMRTVAEGGRTVMLVTHDMGAVTNLCGRALWIDDGTVRADGSASAVVESYLAEVMPPQSFSRNLEHLVRQGPAGQRVKILNVEVQAHEGRLFYGQPLRVRMKIRALHDVVGVVFGIGVSSSLGYRLFTSSNENGTQIDLAGGQRITIDAEVPSPCLPPGKYILSVGARSGGEYGLDHVPDALQFDVSPGPEDAWMVGKPHEGLRIPSRWTMEASHA